MFLRIQGISTNKKINTIRINAKPIFKVMNIKKKFSIWSMVINHITKLILEKTGKNYMTNQTDY